LLYKKKRPITLTDVKTVPKLYVKIQRHTHRNRRLRHVFKFRLKKIFKLRPRRFRRYRLFYRRIHSHYQYVRRQRRLNALGIYVSKSLTVFERKQANFINLRSILPPHLIKKNLPKRKLKKFESHEQTRNRVFRHILYKPLTKAEIHKRKIFKRFILKYKTRPKVIKQKYFGKVKQKFNLIKSSRKVHIKKIKVNKKKTF